MKLNTDDYGVSIEEYSLDNGVWRVSNMHALHPTSIGECIKNLKRKGVPYRIRLTSLNLYECHD